MLSNLLGALMPETTDMENLSVLHAVALLADLPEAGLARGQVGTVVEMVDDGTALVEFSDDEGRAYAIVPYAPRDLLVLHYEREAAQ